MPLVVLQVSDEDGGRGRRRASWRSAAPRPTRSRADRVRVRPATTCCSPRSRRTPTRWRRPPRPSRAGGRPGLHRSWMDRTGDAGIVTMYAAQGRARPRSRPQRAGRRAPRSARPRPAREGVRGLRRRGRRGAVPRRCGRGRVHRPRVCPAASGGRPAAARTSGRCRARRPRCCRVAFEDGWLDGLRSTRSTDRWATAQSLDAMLAQAEQADRAAAARGHRDAARATGVSISVDAGADLEALAESPGPDEGARPGIRIKGDAAKITRGRRQAEGGRRSGRGPGRGPQRGRHGGGRRSTRRTSSRLLAEGRPRLVSRVRGGGARGRPGDRRCSTSTSTPATGGPSSSPTCCPTATPRCRRTSSRSTRWASAVGSTTTRCSTALLRLTTDYSAGRTLVGRRGAAIRCGRNCVSRNELLCAQQDHP